MFRKLGRKRYLVGFQDGTTAGYELALTRIEAMLHSELKKLARSKYEENKDIIEPKKEQKKEENEFQCGQCGAQFSKRHKYCPECGVNFV